MVELYEQNLRGENRQSSKGNQLKWLQDGNWYKADYTGYEGLSEYVVSALLRMSGFSEDEYVLYETEEICYGHQVFRGCKSRNFLPDGWQMITLERLFKQSYGQSLNGSIYRIVDHESRLRFLVDQVERITGLADFGRYMCKLLTVDAFFLNEDRHTHNIAVLLDPAGQYHYCPYFDHGASLLADTTLDYPMGVDIDKLIASVRAKTFCDDFDEQLDIAEKLYGQQVKFAFSERTLTELLDREMAYPEEIKKRVKEIVLERRRKYQYLC